MNKVTPKLPKKSVRAYTLIEVLVVLSIIGVLFGIGYVSYRDFSRRQELAGVAKNIQGES
jgi:prepilin-type N-terminal cleavage/methylation domain